MLVKDRDYRSRDRQGRAVAAPDRNCASSGFPRRTCARLRPGRSPARDSRRVPRGSGPSRARAARQDDEAAEIEGEAMVRPGLRFHGFRRARQRNDPSSVGVPYRASICRRIDGATALRSGGAIDRSPEPGFAIDRRARDVERRAGRAADGSGYVRAARTVGPSGGRGHDAAGDRRAAGTVRTLGRPTPARHPPDHDPPVVGDDERILGRRPGRGSHGDVRRAGARQFRGAGFAPLRRPRHEPSRDAAAAPAADRGHTGLELSLAGRPPPAHGGRLDLSRQRSQGPGALDLL